MGLDQYIFRVKKIKLEDRVYTREELSDMNINYVFLKDIHDEGEENLIEELLPYVTDVNVKSHFLNLKQIKIDYNLPSDSFVEFSSSDGFMIAGYDDNDNEVKQFVNHEEITNKYSVEQVLPCYAWKSEEVQYWRKNYDVQEWIYEAIGHVQNTGYYILDADMIRELNNTFDENIPKEDPDEESALFYWEWY